MRRSLDDIRAALEATGGQVAPAARSLGLARNNLYKRIAGSGVDLAELRRSPGPRPAQERPASEAAALRVARSVYLRPDQITALDEACLDLPAVLREKMSPSKVLERFMDDCFAGWMAGKLGR
jgi:hypothetical protein